MGDNGGGGGRFAGKKWNAPLPLIFKEISILFLHLRKGISHIFVVNELECEFEYALTIINYARINVKAGHRPGI